jgi:iron complex transport system substrate-binding protein
MKKLSQRIVCLTEESVETLFLLNRSDLICGISHYVKRPPEAQSLPKVSFFTHADLDKIVNLKPTLVLGFSDMQKDIARDLIERGLNVFITNQRSLQDIKDYISILARLVDATAEAEQLLALMEEKEKKALAFAQSLKMKPTVYIEEWDGPFICGIQWFSELVELCGGKNIFSEKSLGLLGKDRIVNELEIVEKNPQVILASWCGKKVKISSFHQRKGFNDLTALRYSQIYELPPEIFLQPGPAPFLSGIDFLIDIFKNLKT